MTETKQDRLVPGGGVNLPRADARRILSYPTEILFFAQNQGIYKQLSTAEWQTKAVESRRKTESVVQIEPKSFLRVLSYVEGERFGIAYNV